MAAAIRVSRVAGFSARSPLLNYGIAAKREGGGRREQTGAARSVTAGTAALTLLA